MSTMPTTILLKQQVPLEITVEEYQDLLTQASELLSQCHDDDDDDDNRAAVLQEEWLYAARCGDVDVIRALWQIYSDQLLQLLLPLPPPFTDSTTAATDGKPLQRLLDSNGNTALHLASANGHESTVRLLLLLLPTTNSVRMAVNQAGNTPLHWAAANGHDQIVQLLLYFNNNNSNNNETVEATNDDTPTTTTKSSSCSFHPINVLQKNQFGRSILTEGFTSQNEKVVQLLLEHESASEEKFLLDGHDAKNGRVTMDIDSDDKQIDDDDDDDEKEGDESMDDDDDDDDMMEDPSTNTLNGRIMAALEKDAVVHEFNFCSNGNATVAASANSTWDLSEDSFTSASNNNNNNSLLLRIRELPMHGDNPLGDTAVEDVTGYGIWCASLILARWMADLVSNTIISWKDRSVVELGAGCGVPGLVVACHGQARYVLLTDLNPITVQNLQYNITLNQPLLSSFPSSSYPHEVTANSTSLTWLDRVQASSIDWLDRTTWPQPPPLPEQQLQQQHSIDSPQQQQKQPQQQLFDVVLGSDLIYQASTAPMLRNVVAGLLRPGGTFYYVAPTTTGRDGLSEFIELLQQPTTETPVSSISNAGESNTNDNDNNENDPEATIVSTFRLVAATPAPKQYHENPLGNQDEDDFFLHFHELTSSEYMLYEFEKVQ